MALSDCNREMIEAKASADEIFEAGIQAICVVELADLGNAVMEAVTEAYTEEWTEEERTIVGHFLERVYKKATEVEGEG